MSAAKVRLYPLVVLLTLLLAACAVQPPADQPPAAGQGSAELPQPAVRTPTAESSPTALPPAASATPAEAAATASTATTAETPADSPAEGQQLYDGIPFGQTEAGFPFLGQPDAPVTLIDYSDFL